MKSFLEFIKKHWFGTTVVVATVSIICFGENSYLHLRSLKRQEARLEHEIRSYRDSIAEYEMLIQEVSGNSEELEKFAREKLMMKKENEDVYIIK